MLDVFEDDGAVLGLVVFVVVVVVVVVVAVASSSSSSSSGASVVEGRGNVNLNVSYGSGSANMEQNPDSSEASSEPLAGAVSHQGDSVYGAEVIGREGGNSFGGREWAEIQTHENRWE